MNKLTLVIAVSLISGCAMWAQHQLDTLYGEQDPKRFDTPATPPQGMSYFKDVQPILNARCVVCHACYDAQCQLKLTSWEGVARGASQQKVYDAARILEGTTTRLFVDAQTPSQWRERGFFPVLNERARTPEANRSASLLYRMLELKRQHPPPEGAILPASYDFSLDRDQQCPRIEEFDRFEKNHPQWGMPYGFPAISNAEYATLVRWMEQGAPFEGHADLPPAVIKTVLQWERFLNGDSHKERLTSRYIYEHLFLAHLYFESDQQRQTFRMVRSATPPGQPIREIATRRPYDDPGVSRVYYRLTPEREALVAKTHMPYALGPERMALWRALFLAPDFKVDALPPYSDASNPFVIFQALPAKARYRFMLDQARFTISGFVKGPVCRGQTAVNVIEDQFWVFFANPDAPGADIDSGFLAREHKNMSLPSEAGSNALILTTWLNYSRNEARFLQAKSEYLARNLDTASKVTTDLVWDGDGRNPNAALTVFRHFDSASVVQGLVGEPSKTAWLIGYPLLERIHYLLVAGYDVYGNVGHQLNSRLYMDFLRMEGEFNFLTLLPAAQRSSVRDYWYRGASASVKDYLYGNNAWFNVDSGINYRTSDPQRELYGLLKARLAPVLNKTFDLNTVDDAALRKDLQALATVRGRSLAFMPELGFLRVDAAGSSRYFTLMRNTGHGNVTHLLQESGEILPDENTLTVVPGFIGAYPNSFYVVPAAALAQFTAAVRGLSSEASYRALADRFAIRRTHPQFWTYSDQLQNAYARMAPEEAGLFDYNRFENR